MLKQDSQRIQQKARELFELPTPQPYEEVRPLVIRANVGEIVQINFENKLNRRASIHVQGLPYNVLTSDGANVGLNPDTTLNHIQYIWHADKEGVYLFSDMADPRGNELGTNVHGLFGAIIVEPPQAVYYSSICPKPENYQESAVIAAPGVETFREFVLFAHNGIRLLDKDGNLIKTTEEDGAEGHGAPDHEDTGEKGYNYRSERFFNRLKRIPIIEKVFDSKVHGDPATPLFRAYTGERLIRLLMPADKLRNISFTLHGHRWKAQPEDPFTRVIPLQGAVSVGNVFNIEPEPTRCPGDYLYRSGSLRWDVESGMWGILRITGRNLRCCCETVCRNLHQCCKKILRDKE